MPAGRPRKTEHGIDTLMGMVEKRYNLTRAGAELRIGMSQASSSRVRTGLNPPSARMILALYDNLGLSIEEIRTILGVKK